MTVLSAIFVAVFAIIIVALAVLFTLLIRKNITQGRVVRKQLAKRVVPLRMNKMLAALGIDFDKYLHQVPLHRINESMDKCETCDTVEQCDQSLQKPEISTDNIDFCPNQECLTRYIELQDKQPSST